MTILTYQLREKIIDNVPQPVGNALRIPYYATNYALAKKPRYAIIGTGRCGTKFTTRFLDSIGISCSHEAYYTYKGPLLRNKYRYFKTVADSSWLAIPFLPDQDVCVIHQVRHPLDVISSFYRIGFFHHDQYQSCLLYTSPSPRDRTRSRMPSSA